MFIQLVVSGHNCHWCTMRGVRGGISGLERGINLAQLHVNCTVSFRKLVPERISAHGRWLSRYLADLHDLKTINTKVQVTKVLDLHIFSFHAIQSDSRKNVS